LVKKKSDHVNVASSSFFFFKGTLSLEEREKCQPEYNIIVDDTTMWKKFATHSNPLIRKALYSFIKTSLLQWKGKGINWVFVHDKVTDIMS
jgi:hypothetical protein